MSAKRILVVEDVEDNRRIMHDLLTSAGFEFIEARNGKVGIALAWRHRPQVVVADEITSPAGAFALTKDLKDAEAQARKESRNGAEPSTPVRNNSPAPVSTMQRCFDGVALTSSKKASRSQRICVFMALATSGRLRVSSSSPTPRSSTRAVS